MYTPKNLSVKGNHDMFKTSSLTCFQPLLTVFISCLTERREIKSLHV